MTRARVVLLSCATLLLAVGPAGAEGLPDPSAPTQDGGAGIAAPVVRTPTPAQVHYDAGRAAFEAGALRRAVDEFLAAQQESDLPAFDYNLGICYQRLGDAPRAAAAFRRFLLRANVGAEREEVLRRVAVLERYVGTIVLSSRTPDASVRLDDENIVVPTDGKLLLAAGSHHFVVAKPGFDTRGIDQTVVGGTTTSLDLTLERVGEQARRRRRHRLAIGLGVAGGVVAVGLAIGLGVGLTRGSSVSGNIPSIVVGK